MSEFGGMESYAPGEGATGVPEELSEEAKQRFAAAAAAIKQLKKEEKQSKKRDDKVAHVIIQFLSDKENEHLFLLISRLVARNCPSIFILAILSLIHSESLSEVQNYLNDHDQHPPEGAMDAGMALAKNGELDDASNRELIEWITRMQLVLGLAPEAILSTLMIDEKNIDGTVLQLTTFILQSFFRSKKKDVPFEKIQPLTAGILQTVFEPFISAAKRHYLSMKENQDEE